MDIITMEGGDRLIVTQAHGQVIFMAVAVSTYGGESEIGEGLRLDLIGEHVGEVVGDFISSPQILAKILKVYEEKYKIKSLADFKHVTKMTNDNAYKLFWEREQEHLEYLAAERRRAEYITKLDKRIVPRALYAYGNIRELLPHVSYDTLLSEELCELVNVNSLGISYGEYLKVVRKCIIENPMAVGERRPKDVVYTKTEEVERAKNLLNCVKFGPECCLGYQKKLYLLDVARLAKFASFQTLACTECYVWLGERFKFVGGSNKPRQIKRELMQHVNVVGAVMDRMDPVDITRLRKVFPDDFDNAVLRRHEMIELKYRFGNSFTRNSDESQLKDGLAFDIERKFVIIFYAILKDHFLGVKDPDIKRVISELHAAGKLGNIYTVEGWINVFKPGFVHANVTEIATVNQYINGERFPEGK